MDLSLNDRQRLKIVQERMPENHLHAVGIACKTLRKAAPLPVRSRFLTAPHRYSPTPLDRITLWQGWVPMILAATAEPTARGPRHADVLGQIL